MVTVDRKKTVKFIEIGENKISWKYSLNVWNIMHKVWYLLFYIYLICTLTEEKRPEIFKSSLICISKAIRKSS